METTNLYEGRNVTEGESHEFLMGARTLMISSHLPVQHLVRQLDHSKYFLISVYEVPLPVSLSKKLVHNKDRCLC